MISKDFDGLVISGDQGDDFPFGLDYMHLLKEAEDKHWSYIEHEIKSLQQMMSAIKYCPKATVAAPFQQTLGAACELILGPCTDQIGRAFRI